MRPRWETFEVSESERFPELQGRRVTDLARERGCSPLDVMCEIAVAEDLETRFRAYIANDDVDAVADLLTHDNVVLGLSDAGAHVDQLCDAPLYTDLLGKWVRERSLMPLERAVRKLSGEPADMFGFVRRGYLREGYWADVCVFDPQTVGPGPLRRVRDFPADAERLTADQPTGVRHVLVNGTPIRSDGRSQLDSLEAAARHAARDRLRPDASLAQRVTAGSVSQPRTVDVGESTALSRSTSHSGNRFSTSSRATRPSSRASAAPRQKWAPRPNVRCWPMFRWMSKRSPSG